MGIIKKVASAVTGGSKPKPQPAAATPTKPTTSALDASSPDVIEEERRKRIVALNQQGAGGQMTPSGGVPGQASVARKMLFGM